MDRRRLLLLATGALAGPCLAPAAAMASGGGKKDQPPFISLRPVTATVMRPNGRRGSMTVEVGVNVEDKTLRARAAVSQPLLRAAYLAALQPYALRLAPGAPPNADHIARLFQIETDKVLGRRGARLLLGAVMIN